MLLRKLLISIVVQTAFWIGVLFLPAGTWNWWQAWVLLGVISVATAATTADLYAHNKDILAERLQPPIQKQQPLVDKILVSVLLATYIGALLFVPVDVFRFHHLLGQPGPTVMWLGLAMFNVGWWISYLTLKANAFAAPVVKHQAERHHIVIDTGVYGVVRHPMYAGASLVMIGLPLWLGSYAGALIALLPVAVLAVRCVPEERFLRRELEGYAAYTHRVRYRMVPGIW